MFHLHRVWVPLCPGGSNFLQDTPLQSLHQWVDSHWLHGHSRIPHHSHLCSWTAQQCHSICPRHNEYNGPAWTARCWGGRYQSGRGPEILCPPDSSALLYSSPRKTDQWGSALWIPAGSSDQPNIYQQVKSGLVHYSTIQVCIVHRRRHYGDQSSY